MPVKIHGKEYKTVAERVAEINKDTEGQYSINTELVSYEKPIVVMKATLLVRGQKYTGHAYEDETKGNINKTSALENCETSAIGRCLASASYGGTEFASADEVANAIHQQNAPKESRTENKVHGFKKQPEPLNKPSALDPVESAKRLESFGDSVDGYKSIKDLDQYFQTCEPYIKEHMTPGDQILAMAAYKNAKTILEKGGQ